MSRIGIVVVLTVMWMALWGDFSLANAAAGLVLGTVIGLGTPVLGAPRPKVVRPLQALAYAGSFTAQLLMSTVSVAKLVLSADAPSNRGTFIRYRLSDRGRSVRTLLAHSISLTPGTLTVDVDDRNGTLLVHVLQAQSVEDARLSIAQLERRAVAAFAPLEPLPLPAEETHR